MNFVKRTVTTLTAAAVCLMGVPAALPELADTVMMTASAEDELTYGYLTYEVNDEGTITITGCDKSAEIVEIPAEIDGKAVWGIEGGAFSGCTSLKSITISEGVTYIGYYAFGDCTSLESITIPESVTEINLFILSGCTNLKSITIPESVISIESGAFYGCTSLTSITIPKNVEKFIFDPDLAGPFEGCTSLTEILVDSDNEHFISDEGVLYGKDMYGDDEGYNRLICIPGGKKGSYVIPENVTTIDERGHLDVSLTEIQVDSNNKCFTSKEGVLFSKGWYYNGEWEDTGRYELLHCCRNGNKVDYIIPKGVTDIGRYAFYNCASLTSITIPESVTEIGIAAFEGCTSLTDVYYEGTEEQWDDVFIYWAGNESLEAATIHFKSVETSLGNINGDDAINASDAAVVLIAAAQIGSDGKSDLTKAQQKAADVNKDGKINASDAAIILIYAAAVGSGEQNVKIEDFVTKAQ